MAWCRVVGLTGGIGGGKSEVAALLKERGAVVIDADLMGHELLNVPGVRDRIVARFGASILAAASEEVGGDSTIDRKALGAIVFADPTARRDLEAIVHPGMRASFHAAIDRENSHWRPVKNVSWCSTRRSCSRPAGTTCAI